MEFCFSSKIQFKINQFSLLPGIAYGSRILGTFVNSIASALTSVECLKQCNLESRCLYWYYGGGNCHLLSDDGNGVETSELRSCGKKHSNPGT